MVLGSLASLRPGVTDPFLHSQWKCKPGRKIVQDPKYCDRIMLCGESPEKSVVQYCPNQMVFVRGRSCVPVNRGASHCQRRGVWKLETPNKVHHMCQSNYIAGNRTDVFETSTIYYEKLNENLFAMCRKKQFSKGVPARIFECYDPALPEVANDSEDIFKCKPKGFLEGQKKHKELALKESHFGPKEEVLAGNGLSVQFLDDRPVCPISKELKLRFDFDHTTRFPDNR